MRERVVKACRERGLDVTVQTLDGSTRTVDDAATAVGCGAGQIAKSIVFVADGDPVVCVTSGAHRVDPDCICEALDCAEARQASPSEVRAATGYSVGGVPPLAHGLPVLFDDALMGYERIWAAGGDGHTVFEVDPREMVRSIEATVVPLGASDGAPPAPS
jgi:prolyl-tRNA editing enzyme YbaK/EbsC (Cys-tRNA(Pro) deacylase)